MRARARPHARSAPEPGWTLLAGLALLALASPLACGAAAESSSSSGPVSTGFERATELDRGSFERVSVTRAAARAGSGGLEVHPTGSDAYLRWDTGVLGPDHPFWTFRAWVRIVAWTPTESVDLFTVRNLEMRNNFDLFVAAPTRLLRWDLFRDRTAATRRPVTRDRWYLVEARGSFATSTFTAAVRIDGVTQRSIASPGQTPSAVRDFVLGSMGTAKTHQVQFDDVKVELADAPLPFLGPPAAAPAATRTGTRP